MSLFQTVSERLTYEVVYNLTEWSDGLYLPVALIVSLDKEGQLAHVQQKALENTVESFDLELTETRKRLFRLVDLLQVKAIEKKFNEKNRKPKSLEVLYQEAPVKKAIQQYVHKHLDEVLQLVDRHEFPLCLEINRKVLVKDFLVNVPAPTLEPHLYFDRTADGVYYRLTFKQEGTPWKVLDRSIVPITNHPAWILADYQLYRIAHINGNMIKPFRTKEELFIPNSSLKTYFQRFILKVASKVDIEAEGFEVQKVQALKGCVLTPSKDLFKGNWLIAASMDYGYQSFNWSDKMDKKTTLEFEEDEEIRLMQVLRDKPAEAEWVKRIEAVGLVKAQGSYFKPPEEIDDPYYALEWLANNRNILEENGFVVDEAIHDDRALYLHKPSLKMDVDQGQDWFDLHGAIEVGQYVIRFIDLAKHIRNENRFYLLPDGNYFLIPLEWFNRYAQILQFGKLEGKKLRLSKSQYTLLEDLEVKDAIEMEEDIAFEPSSKLQATLRPYQLEGVKWLVKLYHNDLGGCLADDMGLGKTLQTIATLLHAKEQKPLAESTTDNATQLDLFNASEDDDFLQALNALIVLPASLVFNWEQELNKFAPSLSVYKHTGPKRHKDIRIIRRFDVVLTTYQTALRDVELLRQLEYTYIILDESQQIKNKDSKIFKGINSLIAHHKISLSGTPIENSLSDLWAQMQFINPDLLGSFNFFKRAFITPIERRQDEEQKIQLRKLVQPYLLRRTKEEVAKDLPPLTQKVFYSEMGAEQKKLYEREKSAARNYLLDNFQADNPKFRLVVLQTLTKLRQIVNHPKLVFPHLNVESSKFNDVLAHWELVAKGDHKALVFSSFVKYLELFRGVFEEEERPYSWLTGQLTARQRQKEIEKFEKQQAVQTFFISIKSGGTGLNLTAADYVFILDPWWNPTTEQQAIARAHRIGQEKNVIALKFITKDSIEEKILKLQNKKAQLAEDIIGDVEKAKFSKGDLAYLLD